QSDDPYLGPLLCLVDEGESPSVRGPLRRVQTRAAQPVATQDRPQARPVCVDNGDFVAQVPGGHGPQLAFQGEHDPRPVGRPRWIWGGRGEIDELLDGAGLDVGYVQRAERRAEYPTDDGAEVRPEGDPGPVRRPRERTDAQPALRTRDLAVD